MTPGDGQEVSYRAATAADCEAVAGVNLRSLQESFATDRSLPVHGPGEAERRAAMYRRRFAAGFYRMFVAEAAGHGIVGFVDVGEPREAQWACDAELYSLYVLLPFQRRGVGRRLFELASHAVASAGMHSLYLIVLERNRYRAFYERAGGTALAHRLAGAVPGQDAHRIYAWQGLSRAWTGALRAPGNSGARSAAPAPAHAALLDLISGREAPVERIELDDAGWRRLVGEALRHGVAPLVWQRIRETAWCDELPPRVRHDLQRVSFRVGLDNLKLFAHLGAVLRDFAERHIDVIVLKGACLAETVYADRALRSMADADLLVRRADLQRARDALLAAGWSQPAGNQVQPAGGHQLPTFVMAGSQVEIHWNIEDDRSPFSIDVDGLWSRAWTARIGGVPSRVLAAEDLLLHVCLHASYNHGWLAYADGLRPLCDVAACLLAAERRVAPLDWDRVVQRATQWGASRCIWLTLVLTRDLLDAPVPDRVLGMLAHGCADHGIVRAAALVILDSHYARVATEVPSLGQAWLTKRWRSLGTAGRWRAHLLPGARALSTAYPSAPGPALAPLRYVLHWTELAADALRLRLSPAGHTLRARERDRIALTRWIETVDRV